MTENRRRTASPIQIPEDLEASPEPAPGSGGARVEWLDPKTIVWPEGRITSEYDEEKSAALRASMAQLGQQDAVGVIELEDGALEGSAGMNRCQAAIESGTARILCVVRPGTHRDVVAANIATSINQSRANPLSEVEGIAHAHYEEGFDLADLVAMTGKSEAWIADRLLISYASEAVKQCLGDGRIAIGHAALLATIDDHTAQEEALNAQLTHGWTIAQLDEHLRGGDDGQDGAEAPTRRTRTAKSREPVPCNYCSEEHDQAEMQQLFFCGDCTDRANPKPDLAPGQVAAPVELLRSAGEILAGIQDGASLAERIEELVEGAASDA